MKSLKEYLIESTKTYKFIIKAAGDIPKEFEDKLESAFNKYQVVSFKKGKTTPITETPLDFPQLQNCQVTHYEVEVKYPTTNHVLESYVSLELDFPASHLKIYNENEPLEELSIDKNLSKPYETLLTKNELEAESAQKDVGENRVMDLLKELETAKKERDADTAKAN